MYKHLKISVLCFLWLSFIVHGTADAVNAAKEEDIKAAYLFNLGSYTEWPDSAFVDADAVFKLCILGETPVTQVLQAVAPQRKINNRSTQVIELSADLQAADNCHLIFVAHTAQALVASLLEQVKQKPVLTVSEIERFIHNGGMIEFYMLDNRVRLAIAPESITDTGLKPSSQLMRVAKLRSR